MTVLLVYGGVIAFMIVILVLSYGFSPRQYAIDDKNLYIKRHFRTKVIPLKKIYEVEPVTGKQLGWTLRTFGNGGLFGYYGEFWSSRIGHFSMYTTRRKQGLLVRTIGGRKIIITPDDPEFIHALQSAKSFG